ncbi:hypothetical protein PHMEG_00024262 [Phytophthora megakarya]|uniref:Integrase catalytic domain-containing protein n=1 Tax=Phytophthora megakarya TaxID=4795 RepID=A0A225VGL9_9STRA|nr:hypothetical protein PHMEG_00024262 [Phytophthora megakarya]
MDWYKRFGSPETWQSDCGTHFRNSVLELLSSRLKSKQNFTPPYSPWVNGTVERVNRDVLQVLRVLLMEYQLDTKEWPYLLPVVQANLNHTQLPSLGDKAPVELFTGLPPSSALDMHKEVADIRERRRLQQMAAKKGAPCNFSEGDFVLWSRVDVRLPGNKLMVRWVGPFRVIEALSHSFIIEHLITKARHDVHGSRLKFYADSSLEITEEMVQHVSNQGLLLNVERFCSARFNDELSRWELEVSWQGLEEVENSYEGLEELFNDVPAKVAAYVAESTFEGLRAALAALQE